MEDIVREARELFQKATDANKTNRTEAAQDLKFRAGEQWPEIIKMQRQKDGRPMLTLSRLPQYERQITGDIRLNPPGIKVRPVDGSADPETAKTFTGLIRNIEAQSGGQRAYITAVTNAVRCGEGWFGLLYDYAPDSFDMELSFRRFASPFACTPDPNAEDPTAADMAYCFVDRLMHVEAFKQAYPKALLADWDNGRLWADWREGDFVRVAEFWRRVPVKRDLALLADRSVLDVTGWTAEDVAARKPVKMRKADGFRVEMHKMNGLEVLEEKHDWPGSVIPNIRVVGEEISTGDKIVREGMIRQARDAQALYNIQRTAMAEAVAMAPKAKWMGTAKQFQGYEAHWDNANISNSARLVFTPDERAGGPPQRIAPEIPSQALLVDVQAAAQDIEATIGMYRENLGKESNAQSGKAILSRQREGDVGTFFYADNLAAAVEQAGRILIEVLPKVYDTERQARILGEDGREQFVAINKVERNPITGEEKRINDITVGRYDVVSSVGPSFSTKREEEREMLMAMAQVSPMFLEMGADILVNAMDTPGAEDLGKRLRQAAINKGIVKPGEGDDPPAQQAPGADVLLAQAEQMKAEAALLKAKMEAARAGVELDQGWQELQIKATQVGAKIETDRAATQIKQVETAAKVAGQIAGHHTGRMDRHMDRMDGLTARREDQMMRREERQQRMPPF